MTYDEEISFVMDEFNRAEALQGDAKTEYLRLYGAVEVELALLGVADPALRKHLMVSMPSRLESKDKLRGDAPKTSAKAVAEAILRGPLGDAYEANPHKAKKSGGALTQAELDRMTPLQKINYARKHKVGLS